MKYISCLDLAQRPPCSTSGIEFYTEISDKKIKSMEVVDCYYSPSSSRDEPHLNKRSRESTGRPGSKERKKHLMLS